MEIFTSQNIRQLLTYQGLIDQLRTAFTEDYDVPARLHYDYDSGSGPEPATLMLMPAWKNRHFSGVKILTVSPQNTAHQRDTIQGVYLLFDAPTGKPLAQFDAHTLTNYRTAAASALASSYLSRRDSGTLLVMGTGALAPEMILAHCAVRPITNIWVWGRHFEKALAVANKVVVEGVQIEAVREVKEYVSEADIISTVTRSPRPIVFGKMLRAGQHIDLVGAFKPTWREADDEVMQRSTVFVDTREGTLNESGELLIPMEKGLFSEAKIEGDLLDLCRGNRPGRQNDEEITSFISVGYALEDLAAAELLYSLRMQSMK